MPRSAPPKERSAAEQPKTLLSLLAILRMLNRFSLSPSCLLHDIEVLRVAVVPICSQQRISCPWVAICRKWSPTLVVAHCRVGFCGMVEREQNNECGFDLAFCVGRQGIEP
jgi:hypothetical protein